MTARIHFWRSGDNATCLLAASSICMMTFQDPANPVPTPEQMMRDYSEDYGAIHPWQPAEPERVWRRAAKYGYNVFMPHEPFQWTPYVLRDIIEQGVPVMLIRGYSYHWDGSPATYHAQVLFEWRPIGNLEMFSSWEQARGEQQFIPIRPWDDNGRPGNTLWTHYFRQEERWIQRPFWNGWAMVFVPAGEWGDWRPPGRVPHRMITPE